MITVFHEKDQRVAAANNSKMKLFSVNLKGLNGRPHPTLLNIDTTCDYLKARCHLKFLCDDFFTYEKKPGKTG